MKILFVEASSGQVVGGSLTGMLHLIGGLDKARYEPSVVLYEDKPVIRSLRAQGVKVRVFGKRRLPKEHGLQEKSAYKQAKGYPGVTPLLKGIRAAGTFAFETFPAARRFARVIRERDPDIVHVCNGFRGNLDAIVAARLCGVPCIVHCKGFDKHSFIERLFAPGVAAAVCMTKAIEDHCRSHRMAPPEYHVIYDGLDLEAFRPTRERGDVREELGVRGDAPVVGVVGNIQEWKGQHVLIEAVARMRSELPDITALIVGGAHRSGRGYEERLRQSVAEHGLESNVIFTGARDDVPDIMNAMDVVAHTSVRGEPFGRVIIEGMSVGRPVVATRAGGVPEFVEHEGSGILVEPGDPDALAAVLQRLLTDRAHYDKLAAGALAAVQRFSLQNHVGELSRLYDRVGRSRGGGERPAIEVAAETAGDRT